MLILRSLRLKYLECILQFYVTYLNYSNRCLARNEALSASYIFVNEQHLGTDLVDTQTKSIELTSNGLVSIEAYISLLMGHGAAAMLP